MVDINLQLSLVLPTFNDEKGLYLSLFAAIQQLEKSDLEWEIVIAADGGTPVKWEKADPRVRVMRFTGNNQFGSPQGTRDAGIRMARFKNVVCIDSHVVVSDFEKWTQKHEDLAAALSFPTMVGTSNEMFKIFGNTMDFDGRFWNKTTLSSPHRDFPYQICEFAHSAFMVDREWYIQSGGYTNLLQGYGGEEPYLALKAWMLGEAVWMIPEIWHAHYQPIGRNEGAGERPDFARNFMIGAYVMGGQKYLEKTHRAFPGAYPLRITPEIQAERDKICKGPFRGDLDLLREHFQKHNVVS